MNATISNNRWSQFLEAPSRPVSSGGRRVLVRLGVEPRPAHCPACNSIIYTRRHPRCGVCGGTLPDDCLFTGDEAENVERLLRSERERHRAWLERSRSAHGALAT